MSDYKVENLPKWAQRRIEKLERDVEWWRQQVASMESRDTNVFIWSGKQEDDQPLPRNTRIRFQAGDRFSEYFEVELDRETGKSLSVRGGVRVAIRPLSSNMLVIKLEEQ